MHRRHQLAALVALGAACLAPLAVAQPALPTPIKVAYHLKRASAYARARQQVRAAHELLEAMAADPTRHEPWLRLADYWRDRRELLVREAYRRRPDDKLVCLATANALGRAPEQRKWGRATSLALFYPARSAHDCSRDRRVSLEVGQTIDPRCLVVQGLDAEGNRDKLGKDFPGDWNAGKGGNIDPKTGERR